MEKHVTAEEFENMNENERVESLVGIAAPILSTLSVQGVVTFIATVMITYADMHERRLEMMLAMRGLLWQILDQHGDLSALVAKDNEEQKTPKKRGRKKKQ